MNRFYERGMICDPRHKAKSVIFADAGLADSPRLLEKLFDKPE